MEKKQSLDQNYFDDVYAASDDPWDFESSPYEAEKYAATLAALPRANYQNALEIGCSIGVLTEMLAKRCTKLLATDVSAKALAQAEKRCKDLQNITFRKAGFPAELPHDCFDLIMISEVAYYLSPADWQAAIKLIEERTPAGGHVVLVHWLPAVHDYPQTGDEVHETFKKLMKDKMKNVRSQREEKYRLDVWEKC